MEGTKISDETEPPDLREAVMTALACAVLGEKDALIERLADIAGWGPRGVFTAVCGWSAVTLKAMTGEDGPDDGSFFELEVTSLDTGEAADIAGVGRDERAAVQMVTLYGNGDSGTMIALVDAAFEEDCGTGLMVQSVGLAAQAAKRFKEESR